MEMATFRGRGPLSLFEQTEQAAPDFGRHQNDSQFSK
jgi:hypothetical protein